MNNIDSMTHLEIKKAVLQKDEKLLKLGNPKADSRIKKSEDRLVPQAPMYTNGQSFAPQMDSLGSFINTVINGSNESGNKTKRTITITISDEGI